MTATNRVDYLVQTLLSMRDASPSGHGWTMNRIRIEPTEVSWHLARAAADAGIFPPSNIVLNREGKLGPNENPRRVIEDCFNAGADVVLYCQDDCRLAPDAFELADWYGGEPLADAYLCLFLLNYESDPSRPEHVIPTRGEKAQELQGCPFHSGGAFVITRGQWPRLDDWWYTDGRGSDWAIGERWMETPGLKALVPALSRCNHIGRRDGTFCQPAFHDRLFGSLAVSDRARTNFRMVAP